MKKSSVIATIAGIWLAGCAVTTTPGPSRTAQSPLPAVQGDTTGMKTAPLTVTITVPPRPGLKANYISPSTASVQITYTGGGNVVQNVGSGTTSFTFEAPLGTTTYTVTVWSGTSATGSQLATGSAPGTVNEGVSNALSVPVLGIPGAITLTLANTTPIISSAPAAITLTVAVNDAGGNPISGTYNNTPSVSSLGDTNSIALLSANGGTAATSTSVAGSGTSVAVNYNDSSSTPTQGYAVTYTASVTTPNGTVTSNTVTLTPTGIVAFPANSNRSFITPTFLTFATQNIDVRQVNGTLPIASGCAGIASTVVTQDAAGDYNAAVTPTSPAGGNCTITLTGAASQTGTINFNFSP